MANTKSSKSMEVPEAKAAMDRFKTEVASELGVNLKEGYNGDLTSKEAGSIGGEMVRLWARSSACRSWWREHVPLFMPFALRSRKKGFQK